MQLVRPHHHLVAVSDSRYLVYSSHLRAGAAPDLGNTSDATLRAETDGSHHIPAGLVQSGAAHRTSPAPDIAAPSAVDRGLDRTAGHSAPSPVCPARRCTASDGSVPASYGASMNWRSAAACVNVDPELFFPNGTSPAARAQTRDAKRVCARCSVIQQCRDWAEQTGQREGVWGGLDGRERASLHRRERRVDALRAPPPSRRDAYPVGSAKA